MCVSSAVQSLRLAARQWVIAHQKSDHDTIKLHLLFWLSHTKSWPMFLIDGVSVMNGMFASVTLAYGHTKAFVEASNLPVSRLSRRVGCLSLRRQPYFLTTTSNKQKPMIMLLEIRTL